MAQLSDDCFAFGGPLMTIEEAVSLITSRVSPLPDVETLPLPDCDGRVLAADLVAPLPLPPFENSAVDGYAVRHADLTAEGDTVLPVLGRTPAGARAEPLAPGTAQRVFTGAPMPAGADTVFMQEDVAVLEGGHVSLPRGLKPGANTRPAGEDVAQASVALPAGQRLGPAHLALAAALGQTALPVRRKPRVAIFSTGNEVVPPGRPLGPAQLYDANRFLLSSLVRRAGGEVMDLGILSDEPESLSAALASAAAQADLVLTSGGVSTGEEDHVKAAVETAGRLVFWRIAIKPGRPVAMGVVRGAAFVGLPGNPVAVFVTFVNIVRPLMAALAGEPQATPVRYPVRAAFSYKKKTGRREFVRVSVAVDGEGALVAQKHPREGAGILSSLTQTTGLVELPEDSGGVAPGDAVSYLPFSALI